MAVAISTLILFFLLIPSLIVYIMFLVGLFRFRRKHPFNSAFFKLFFAIGVIDIVRLIEDWFLFKFASLGWFWVDKLVLTMPHFFAKLLHSVIMWYFAHAQVFGTLILAVNRLSTCAFLKDWTTEELRMSLISLWGLPLLTNIPLWPLDFHFSGNGTMGVLLFWDDTTWQWYYLTFCGFLCCGTAASCAIIYAVILAKVRQRRSEVKVKKRENKKNNEELNLIVLGVVLTVLAACCGTVCAMMGYGISAETLTTILPYFNLVNDILFCWINPYLLFICSTAVKKHMKAFFCCKNNRVNVVAVARVQKSNKKATSRV